MSELTLDEDQRVPRGQPGRRRGVPERVKRHVAQAPRPRAPTRASRARSCDSAGQARCAGSSGRGAGSWRARRRGSG
jgi:hypothetical protein